MKPALLTATAALLAIAACGHPEARPPPATAVSASPATPPPTPKLDRVARADFNRIAADLALPIFWRADANHDGRVDPPELGVYWGLNPAVTLQDLVKDGAFTPRFFQAYEQIAGWSENGPQLPSEVGDQERTRRKLVVEELEQSRPTLVETDLRQAPADEQAFVNAVLDIASAIDRLYAKQLGVWDLRTRVPENDPSSHTVFYRNHGFHCVAPRTQSNPQCSAIPDPPAEKRSGLYPEGPLQQPGFCESLGKDKALIDPFTAVRTGPNGSLVAVPYSKAFAEDMGQISRLLSRAADALPAGKEDALRAYLRADAQAFLDNQWTPADEAWAKMNASNSKWYVRIAPDETYAEPCSTKALFQVSFGLINQGSLKWQRLLTPLQNEMEQAVARLAGPPYRARKVTFRLPDFFDVAINAGDARAPAGATVGESLPNFGPVANEGRGRTVAMTNFYTDPDSLASLAQNAQSLLCPEVMPHFTVDPGPELMSTILHEATHNLGPAAQYEAHGKIDVVAFGGPLASMLEELKAQSGASFFIDWLARKGLISAAYAQQAHVSDLLWNLGQISSGMFDSAHHPLAYPELSAMQLGFLMRGGAVRWKPETPAANGKDQGCFAIDFARIAGADTAMLRKVAGIKARGDRPEAEAWAKEDVEVIGAAAALRQTITDRMLRAPNATFVYDVTLK